MTGPARSLVAALALGSNLGDRMDYLRAAVDALRRAEGVRVDEVSSVYETAPVGTSGQPEYLNAVVLVTTDLTPRELITLTQHIENVNGRVRLERWGPRTLDVDVLTVGEEISDDPVILLPHPRAHDRAFVLLPWSEIDPEGCVPGHGRVRDLLAALPVEDVEAVRAHRVGTLDLAQ